MKVKLDVRELHFSHPLHARFFLNLFLHVCMPFGIVVTLDWDTVPMYEQYHSTEAKTPTLQLRHGQVKRKTIQGPQI